MKCLIVRAGTYPDEKRQRVVNLINEIWKMVDVPDGICVITRGMNTKWLSAGEKLFTGHFFRYWAAWGAFRVKPAEWLVILDIDVIPLRKDALAHLAEFLNSLPLDVTLATRCLIGCWSLVKDNYFNPSEGIFAIRKNYAPALLLSQLHYHFFVSHKMAVKEAMGYITPMEGQLTSHLPRRKVAYFPPSLCEIKGVAEISIDEPVAFIHPGGDISHPRFIDCVLTLLGRFLKEA